MKLYVCGGCDWSIRNNNWFWVDRQFPDVQQAMREYSRIKSIVRTLETPGPDEKHKFDEATDCDVCGETSSRRLYPYRMKSHG